MSCFVVENYKANFIFHLNSITQVECNLSTIIILRDQITHVRLDKQVQITVLRMKNMAVFF